MADTFQLYGSCVIQPATGSPSFGPAIPIPIDETLTLKAKLVQDVLLTDTNQFLVDFGTLAEAHVVIIKTVGGNISAQLTSSHGAAQDVPVDSVFMSIAETEPYTALGLTAAAGQGNIQVRVFLGEKE